VDLLFAHYSPLLTVSELKNDSIHNVGNVSTIVDINVIPLHAIPIMQQQKLSFTTIDSQPDYGSAKYVA